MKNTFRQIGKIFALYIVGWILLYPIYIIVGFITHNNVFWLPLICLFVFGEGVFLWKLKHHNTPSKRVENLKNINVTYFKNLVIQSISVLALFILIVLKESNQLFYSLMPYYEFLKNISGSRELARILSFSNIPIVNIGNFLIVSIGWVSYNITQLLFNRRIRQYS